MKYVLLFIWLICAGQVQSKVVSSFSPIILKDTFNLAGSMQTAFHPRGSSPILKCGKGIFFVSFKVSRKDNLENLAFSSTTPPEMRSFLQPFLLGMNGQWGTIVKSAKKKATTYLLPISYWLGNCPGSGDTVFIVNREIYAASRTPNISDSLVVPAFYNDLLNITNFEANANRDSKGGYVQFSILPTVVLRKRIVE